MVPSGNRVPIKQKFPVFSPAFFSLGTASLLLVSMQSPVSRCFCWKDEPVLSLCVCAIPLMVGDVIQVVAFGRTLFTFLLTSILFYVWTTFCSSVSLLICELDTINLLPCTLVLKHLFKTLFLNIFCMHLVGFLVLYNPLLKVCEHPKTLA